MESQPKRSQFSFDFTLTGVKLIEHIAQVTKRMRADIIEKRKELQEPKKNKGPTILDYIQYQAKVPQISAYVIKDKQPYQPLSLIVKQRITLQLSVYNLYPKGCSQIQLSGKIKQQCYPINIGQEKFKMIGVNYSGHNDLGDFLAMLVAEQIRFDTMDNFFSFEQQFHGNANNLFSKLKILFKDNIYQNWGIKWQTRIIMEKQVKKIIQLLPIPT